MTGQQGGYQDLWADFQVWEAITSVYTDLLGEPLVALLFFGATGAAFYILQQRMIIPLVTLILIGGIALANIPAQASRVVIIFVMLSLASLLYLLYQAALGSSQYQ